MPSALSIKEKLLPRHLLVRQCDAIESSVFFVVPTKTRPLKDKKMQQLSNHINID